MNRTRVVSLVGLAGLAWLALSLPDLHSQEPSTQPAFVQLRVPADAILEIEGVKTLQTGELRRFKSPPLATGKKFNYKIKLTYKDADGKEVVKEESISVQAGQETTVDLRPAVAKVDKTPVAEKAKPKLDVPYVPTPQNVVDEMLKLAKVGKDDVVFDLGCGDGRIVVTAAKQYGAKGVGIDLDPARVKDSLDNVKKNKVEELVEIREGNALKVEDLSKATVVTLYLLPRINLELRPQLLKDLKPGTRIVSHDFDMGDWKPLKQISVPSGRPNPHTLYLWEIPGAEKPPVVKEEKKEPEKPPVTKVEKKDAEKPPVVKEEKKEPEKTTAKPKLDVPYVSTPQEVVEKMLEMAKVSKDDVVYDLGCGDGRIVVTAAKKFGAKGVGIDLDPERVRDSLINVKKEGVEKLVEIREGNALKVEDLGKASVVTLYLLPEINLKLRAQLLKELKPGSRVVSHDFDMGDWEPLAKHTMAGSDGNEHDIYLWKVGVGKEEKKEEPKKEDAKKEEPKKDDAKKDDTKKEELKKEEKKELDRAPDVIYVPTPQEVVDRMLELAKVAKDDVVYDLGCGDGRIVVTAAKKFGAKGIGYDIDPKRVAESLENVKKGKVDELVKIEKKDIFTLDLSTASVITLYLLPELNVKLIPQLEKLKPGSRIVSHDFGMKGVKPDHTETMEIMDEEGVKRPHKIYLWTIPLKKEKTDDKE